MKAHHPRCGHACGNKQCQQLHLYQSVGDIPKQALQPKQQLQGHPH